MTDQWFYKLFGEEFGPMPLEKLKELADAGTIQAFDPVRSLSSDWIAAATIDELGLSTSERRTNASMAAMSSTEPVMSTTQAGADDWYYQLGGQELGPLSFEELLDHAENGQLSADDEVKLGSSGKWRRVGSIGRLMTALPYKEVQQTIVPTPPKPKENLSQIQLPEVQDPVIPSHESVPVMALDSEATYRMAYEEARTRVMESTMAQADAAFTAVETQAQSQIAWATAPNVDRLWWGWAGGVEFGPVEFNQVLGLAKAGQLKPTDFVRNGQSGQFVPSANVPGLFKAVEMMARATETRNLAKAQAEAAASLVTAPPASQVMLRTPVVNSVAELRVSLPVHGTSEPKPQVSRQPKSDPTVEPVRQQQLRQRPELQLDINIDYPAAPVRTAPIETASESNRSAFNSASYSSPNVGVSSSMSGSSSASISPISTHPSRRPAAIPVRRPSRKKSASDGAWFSGMIEGLKDSGTIKAAIPIVLVLLVVGWGYLPKSHGDDVRRYRTLAQLLDEIKAKRATAPAELAALQGKLESAAKQIAAEVKDKAGRDEPAKQCLLWATRDEVPRLIQAGLTTESAAEKNFASRLQETAYILQLQKRPPMELVQIGSPPKDN